MALQTPQFYLAGSIEPKVRRARKSEFEQALKTAKIHNLNSLQAIYKRVSPLANPFNNL
ncbi:MAG: hypothetical protein LBD18_07540 [Treponema sp.]|nr:hypothetical protein [Treponema sp.]